MSSLVAQLLAPGGGIILIPFIRYVIMLLLLVTSTAFILGVARIHMAVLSFLGGGLLLSISMFQSEYEKVNAVRSRSNDDDSSRQPAMSSDNEKTD
mmetsp:Transcript_6424/g.6026  ORF Transcript_6424/g.6026 Transcript_6424/m.6026 type:complete len:96 (-) Transcript_6424:278-565(-)|eukprot:CAMPEP_0197834530 /NCGR_PEP_ID=MMETSP1437-20131217/22687_1 /TAXON_ID=49252 ORGANISM="Eucampia antarctica, Strain CCMP1452" /NCGR_SAMPLE_ID=MMETSP1437 /ASSEMBLY_ACC=CAM_ASM_001096 /LENGTH=95 /DNA_ID=CAMNT_0043439267 /DNA_START=49 /DNA_END=336 /DNA_ORIENTATION=-